jgi:hypothetical protein
MNVTIRAMFVGNHFYGMITCVAINVLTEKNQSTNVPIVVKGSTRKSTLRNMKEFIRAINRLSAKFVAKDLHSVAISNLTLLNILSSDFVEN